MKNWLLPINILIIFLTALTLWACFSWSGPDPASLLIHLRNLFLIFGSGLAVRFLIRKLIDPTISFRLEHRIITALILFLLFDPLTSWWTFLVLGAITEGAQYFLRGPGGPLFNPAALGVLIVSIFGTLPSWWGTNPLPRVSLLGEPFSLAALFTLLVAGYVVYRYRKLPISLSAFGAFALTYALLYGDSPVYIALEGTLLFFFLVMVPEPKTSPVVPKEQYLYGALVGAGTALGLYFHFIEAYVIALLVGNLYTGRRFLCGLLRPSAPVDASPQVR